MTTETVAQVESVAPQNAAKIIKQVEFYFSDANLPRDRFLQEELKKNEEGWIALSVISSFSRMKTLASSVEEIAAALRSAADASFIEVSEDGACIRRKTALPEGPMDCMRTGVFVRGLPVEGTTLEALESFFEGVCTEGSIAAIRMRRHPQTKAFKGSVFLVLKTEEEASRLVEVKTVKFTEECELEILSMTAFMEEQNAKAMARAKKSEVAEVEETPLTIESVKPMILTITGCPSELNHRLLRTALLSKGPVAFVDNVTAEGNSVVRFKEPVAAELIEKINAEGGIRMPDVEAPLMAREATAEEIEAFFAKMQEFKTKAAGNNNNSFKKNKFKRVKRN